MSISKLWDNFKQANTCGSGVPKNEEIMAKTLPNLKNYKRQSLNTPNQKNKENYTQVYHNQIAWNQWLKSLKSDLKTYRGAKIRMAADFLLETMQSRSRCQHL